MTREEAIKRVFKIFDGENLNDGILVVAPGLIVDLIDRIYDDFESRICKNCKYYNNGNCPILQGASVKYVLDWLDETFGCNKFERKEKWEKLSLNAFLKLYKKSLIL